MNRKESDICFFEPWIGEKYEEKFLGGRTLVVGVCHFCTTPCEFHHLCGTAAGIREMDSKCPVYSKLEDAEKEKGHFRLSNSNNIEIQSFIDGDAPYPSYKLFTCYMTRCTGELSREKRKELWEHVAFTNFLQFFHDDRDMLPSEPQLYDEAYPALREVVADIKADVVYVWSDKIKDCLKKHKEDIRYLGKTNLSFGIPLYVFLPFKSNLTGTALGRLRYRLGIETEKHHLGWYKKLLKRYLGSCIAGVEYEKGKIIHDLANRLMNLVEDGVLGASEEGLYFNDSDEHRWTSKLKGFFLVTVRDSYTEFGRGFNPGMEAIFGERLATNKRSPNESDGPEVKIARAIRRAFPSK